MFKLKIMQPRIYFTAILFLFISVSVTHAQSLLLTPGLNSVLYLGEGSHQPLVVGLGGSEGGNAWAGDHWKKTRDEFISKGYAFLAIGYFGVEGAPAVLDRISVNQVHDAILQAASHPKIDKHKIALVGGSRGGDLALLLGSYYSDINCIVAIVPSHVVFPAHTGDFSTSAFMYDYKELSFVPVNEESVPFLMKRDLRGAFETMLKDSVAESKALIRVEKINGPVLFLSAKEDEICPSEQMCDKMMARLKQFHFPYSYQHISWPGKHAEPLKHFDKVFDFMEKYFPVKNR